MAGIGWDVVTMLLPFVGQKETRQNAVKVLDIVAEKGNAKEVFLKCNEGLKNIVWKRNYFDKDDEDGEATMSEKLAQICIEDKTTKMDPVSQTKELYRATKIGI